MAAHSRLIGQVAHLLQSGPEARLAHLGLEVIFIIIRLDYNNGSLTRLLGLALSGNIGVNELGEDIDRLLEVTGIEGEGTRLLAEALRSASAPESRGQRCLRRSRGLVKKAETHHGLSRADD